MKSKDKGVKSPTIINKTILLIGLLMMGIQFEAYAAQGCLLSNGYVYTTLITGTTYSISAKLNTTCPAGSTTMTQYAKTTAVNPPTTCTVNQVPGTLVNYTTAQCQLDDYLALLFIPVALLTIYKFKRPSDFK